MNRNQRRGARRVYCHARPSQIKRVGDPPGQNAPRGSRRNVEIDLFTRTKVILDILVVGSTGSNKDARRASAEFLRNLSTVFKRFPNNLQKVSLLGIHLQSFARRDMKERRVELVDSVEEAAHTRGNFARCSGTSIIYALNFNAILWGLANGVDLFGEQSPEGLCSVHAREAASDTHYCYRLP